MKRLFKWALYLFIILVVLVVAGVLLLDTIVKQIVQSNLRAQTGMDVKIGKLDIGLSTPTLSVENFKLYNTAEFGGSPCLDVPEVYVEYDKQAVSERKLHIKLLRINIAEVNVVTDRQGKMNLLAIEAKSLAATQAVKAQTPGFKFTGIDTLNVTLGKLHLTSLAAPGKGEEINFGITNQTFSNIKTEADLQGMAVVLASRSSGSAPPGAPPIDLPRILKELLTVPKGPPK